jgi:uncharacterized protein (TIGR03790 family)
MELMQVRSRWPLGLLLLVGFCPLPLFAGGSGLNVVVVVNQASTNSVQLGNYYMERRQVPPQNLLRTTWTGGNIDWTLTDFQNVILNPLLSMISARQLTNQIDYVVLSMDFPFRVNDSSGVNATTAALYYGFKGDFPAPTTNDPVSCNLPTGSSNSYAGSECIFRYSPPTTAATNAFLATMITGTNLDLTKMVVDQGVLGDYSFPTQTVILGKSTDPFRNVRYVGFDNTIFETRLRGNYNVIRTNSNYPWAFNNILGYENGHSLFSVNPNEFAPGAMADSLTSYGGVIFNDYGQTTLLTFLWAGASGSYGTVVEPCNYLEKFPSSQTYFYQARGFSLAESYYQSVTNPYQGLMVGEPLSAPFAQVASAAWSNLPANSLLSGTTNLSFVANNDSRHAIQRVDLFLDGNYLQTVTNIPPRTNNILYVTLNGVQTNYTIPAGASIGSAVSNLALRLNATAYANATKVQAFTHGDRIELRSTDITKTGAQTSLFTSNSIGSASALTTFLSASRTNFLDTTAYGIRDHFFQNDPSAGSFLQLIVIKTNGQTVITSVTNDSGWTTTSQIAQAFTNAVAGNAALQGLDGVVIEDVIMYEDFGYGPAVEFNIRARSPGWAAAQVQVRFTGSGTFIFQPSSGSTNKLDEHLPDLQPRNHLYVTAGLTNLLLSIPFNTTTLPDGFHELTAVTYEGSHVRTETRVAQNVRIQNSPLSAVLAVLPNATNLTLSSTLQFSIVANTNNISKIELFSTGGSLGSALNQSNASFPIAGTNMGLGLHPFYAIVTASTGKQYRTQTLWIRLVSSDVPFPVTIAAPPPTLTWPATPGRSYDILSATNLTNAFVLRDTVIPSTSLGQWTETNSSSIQRFYRVRTSN